MHCWPINLLFCIQDDEASCRVCTVSILCACSCLSYFPSQEYPWNSLRFIWDTCIQYVIYTDLSDSGSFLRVIVQKTEPNAVRSQKNVFGFDSRVRRYGLPGCLLANCVLRITAVVPRLWSLAQRRVHSPKKRSWSADLGTATCSHRRVLLVQLVLGTRIYRWDKGLGRGETASHLKCKG